jgi:hypothetical protein
VIERGALASGLGAFRGLSLEPHEDGDDEAAENGS